MSDPWTMLGEIERELVHYLARTGSLDDSLLKALILIREIIQDFEITLAKAEIDEYAPAIH